MLHKDLMFSKWNFPLLSAIAIMEKESKKAQCVCHN